ncbi:MAG: natural resistance-associated macrophage protein [Gemmatimonadetes bacterium]|jgi:Mn2+/Fe2+ NRAMP family transporter|nr:natural resistance-associated macrophage protein [Gemmatimonadota bacterium]
MAGNAKKWSELALGLVTGIGGFLEVGSIITATQAGAEFGLQLVWVVLLGTIALAILMEMSGRLAIVSKRTYVDLLRERFGIRFFVVPLVVVLGVSFLVLASEIGGVSTALQMATGISARWWALPVAFVGWFLLWRGTFTVVEQGTAIFGMVSLAFAVGAWKLHPQWGAVAAAALPSAPSHDAARYWYIAVSIIGASVSPYLFIFYSSGAIEERWEMDYIGVNRATSVLGNMFGGGLSVAVLVSAAVVLAHVKVDSFDIVSRTLSTPLGRAGLWLFIATLCITCFGATLEIALSMAYLLAQGFGWPWSENLPPRKDARFSGVYTVIILGAALLMAAGVDPLGLTTVTMIATAASLPLTIVPLLVLMNDAGVMSKYTNGRTANTALVILSIIALVLLFAAIPLQILGG